MKHFRQVADQQFMPPGYPAVNRTGWPSAQGVGDQGFGGDLVVDQAQFVLQLCQRGQIGLQALLR